MKHSATFWVSRFCLRLPRPSFSALPDPLTLSREARLCGEKDRVILSTAVTAAKQTLSSGFTLGIVRSTANWHGRGIRQPMNGRRVSMKNENGRLFAELPHQPPGGKLQYRVLLDDGVESISLPANGCRGDAFQEEKFLLRF